jgi:hypothetical protein
MKASGKGNDLSAVLQRLDSRSPDAFIQSLAAEITRLHSALASLEGRLAAMETLASLADRIVEEITEPTTVFPAQIEIRADSLWLDFVGFYELEYDEKGNGFRWTGPERHFSFQVFLDRRTTSVFTLTYQEVIDDEALEGLRSFVDGVEVALSVRPAVHGYLATGVLPPRKGSGGTVLTFVVAAVSPPSATGDSDQRPLGLKFRSLVVEPSRNASEAPFPGSTHAGEPDADERPGASDAMTEHLQKGARFGSAKRAGK